jgi:PAS domain-containing protein
MILTAVIAGSVAVLGLGLWLHLSVQERLGSIRRLKTDAEGAARLQAILESAGDGIAAFGASGPRFWGAGERLLQTGLAGQDGARLRLSLAALWDGGRPFHFQDRTVSVRGRRLAGQDVLFLESPHGGGDDAEWIAHLPLAVALFRADRRLERCNEAFAGLWSLTSDWLAATPTLDALFDLLRDKRRLPEQRHFQDWKRAQLAAFEAPAPQTQTWHLPSGVSLKIIAQRRGQGGLILICEDISEKLRLEASLNLLTQVHKATLDTLDEAVAIFGTDGRLALHNAMFVQMWKLPESELSEHPHFSRIAELATQRIGHDGIWAIVSRGINSPAPERFAEWGRARRADGKILSLSLSRLPNGGTFVSFSDLTDLEQLDFTEAEGDIAAA